MKLFKKIIIQVLTIILLIVSTPIQELKAQETNDVELSLNSVTIIQDEYFNLYASLKNAVDLGVLKYNVYYDADMFEVINVYDLGTDSSSYVDINTSKSGVINVSILNMNGLNGDIDITGFYLHVIKEAKAGDYTFNIAVEEAYNNSFEGINIKKKNAHILVNLGNFDNIKTIDLFSTFNEVEDGYRLCVYTTNINGLTAGEFLIEYDPTIFKFENIKMSESLTSNHFIIDVNDRVPGNIRFIVSDIESWTTDTYADLFEANFSRLSTDSCDTKMTLIPKNLIDENRNEIVGNEYTTNISLAKEDTSLYINWDKTYDSEDRSFIVECKLTGESSVGAGDFVITYNQNILSCESVIPISQNGAMVVTNPNIENGNINFSYVNPNGCKTESTILRIKFKPVGFVVGSAILNVNGRNVYDSDLNNVNIKYKGLYFELPPLIEKNITYYLNGGELSQNNPSKYIPGYSDFTLNSPTKEHAEFVGWYLETDFTNKIEMINTELTGDLSLYAKWKTLFSELVSFNVHAELSDSIGLMFDITNIDSEIKISCSINDETIDDDIDFSNTFVIELAPKQIFEKIEFFAYNESEREKVLSISLDDYLVSLINSDTSTDKVRNIANSLRDYGKSSDEYFNNKISTNTITFPNVNSYKYKINTYNDQDGIAISGTTLLLESKTSFRIYFDTDNINNYLFKVSDNRQFVIGDNDGESYLEIPNIKATELSKMFNIAVFDKSGEKELINMDYSVLSYVNIVNRTDCSKSLKNVAASLATYALSAK